jgi:hypothetical protein
MAKARYTECKSCVEQPNCNSSKREFNVVFQGVGAERGGNFKGVRTITDYGCEVHFKSQKDQNAIGCDTVIAEGTSLSEAQRLCDFVSENTLRKAADQSEHPDLVHRNVSFLLEYRKRKLQEN